MEASVPEVLNEARSSVESRSLFRFGVDEGVGLGLAAIACSDRRWSIKDRGRNGTENPLAFDRILEVKKKKKE